MKSVFVIACIMSAVCALQAQANTVAGTASVIDGGTLEIHGTRIRLNAMDAIESRQRCTLHNGREWSCGQDAAFALADKIGLAPVSCKVTGKDRYGRSVATCFLRGDDLGGWMAENGWAVAYRRYGIQYVPAEDRARKARRGIWASRFVVPSEWRKGQR